MSDSQNQQHATWLRDTFRDHRGSLLAYAVRMTGERHRAEEAVQETFLRLCRDPEKADSLRTGDGSGEHLRAWLFKVCRSRIIDMQRTDHPPPPTAHGDSVRPNGENRPDPGETPAEAAERVEASEQLTRLIETLSPRQRELLHLRIHGQLSYRELAEATGLSVSNVGFQLHRAMQTLREKLGAV